MSKSNGKERCLSSLLVWTDPESIVVFVAERVVLFDFDSERLCQILRLRLEDEGSEGARKGGVTQLL